MKEKEFITQVKLGERFEFGKNWESYLNNLTTEQVTIAKESLIEMIPFSNFVEKSFLDIGCGSGLFSLSAAKLGAKVFSIDFDPKSVECARFLKRKFNISNDVWKIEQESVLNTKYFMGLPKFDVVYSWGVLHHTGNLELALENAIIPVKDNGILFISIYNDQGRKSRFWLKIKKLYNSLFVGKVAVTIFFYSYYAIIGFVKDMVMLKNPLKRYKDYKRKRGMSMTHDWKDWLGGLPFEVASPEYIVDFYLSRGFTLKKIRTTNSLGCNQFVFKKIGHNNNN